MGETPKETLTWTDLYLKSQEEFLRRWSELAGGAARAAQAAAGGGGVGNGGGGIGGVGAGAGGGPAAAGADGAAGHFGAASGRDWFAMFAPRFTGAAGGLAERYFGFYDQYLAATRGLWEVLAKATADPDPETRARTFTDGLQALQQPFTQLWSQSATLFGLPLSPGAGGGGADPFQTLASFFRGSAELPALGLTRERQQSLQRIQSLASQYLQQQARLLQLWNGVVGDALRLLGERVGRKLAAGKTIDGTKALYDLWIESAEEIYAKVAHGPEYAKAQAELGNTLAKLRIEQRLAIDSLARQYDLPTREELNTVHRRLRDLKAELRRVNAKLEAAQQARVMTAAAAPTPTPAARKTSTAKPTSIRATNTSATTTRPATIRATTRAGTARKGR